MRNANAASAPVETVEELRTLIGLATKKRSDELFATFHAMLQGRPLVPPPTHEEQFQHELEEIETATATDRTKKGNGPLRFTQLPTMLSAGRNGMALRELSDNIPFGS